MYRRDVLGIVAGTGAGTFVDRVGHPTTSGGEATPADPGAGAADPARATTAPSEFTPLGSLPIEGAREAVVGADGTTAYLAVEDGFVVVDVSDPTEPRQLAERRGLFLEESDETLRQVQDVAAEGDRLLVMGPAHGGVAGPEAALLYDVSDPADPRRVAVHSTDYPIHNGTLADGLAYLTANDGEANPVEIVEMGPGEAGATSSEPEVLGRWSIVDADDAWADVPSRLRPIHDVIVHRGVAYCSYWDAGTWLVDVGDPSAPHAIGRVGARSPAELAAVSDPDVEDTELPGNHHSAAVDDSGTLLAVGHEAWDDDGDGEGAPGGIDLVDVSSPESPEVLATIEPPPTPDPSRDGTWTTAHNFELRGGRLYSAWYHGGVCVHDVSEPEDPRELAAWRDSATARFWTAQLAGEADGGDGSGAVVASSMGTDEGEAGLYAFPGSASGGGSGPRQVTATPGMAGFGLLAALAGSGIGWLLARRRNR